MGSAHIEGNSAFKLLDRSEKSMPLGRNKIFSLRNSHNESAVNVNNWYVNVPNARCRIMDRKGSENVA